MMGSMIVFLFLLLAVDDSTTLSVNSNPEYVKQCSRSDPKLKTCLINALHHLRPYLSVGIPEIELPSVEPFRMDELTLSLTGGTNGYKVQLRELFVRGASNYTVEDIKLGSPFEAIVRMPALILDAHYTSSGVLIILPASGNGTFHGRFDDLKALVKGTVSTKVKDGKTYLNLENLDVDLEVKNVHMRVRKIFNNNRILTEATNLFLRENGQEVLKAMEPQLKKKLSVLFAGIVNQLLRHVPVEVFLLP
ncbi:PREDICTED: protein takeout-like [Dufourea novaeangliae]|uniref:Protein takeout n=1 Tax=Dufourea novaeangliae TaxID=178035 RepID=A0A154PNK9_DUFNO|nr:PREDICTED: protein takeout-like [Dufourea novaeangliae]KZC13433.1 Protein takeout [Dufourea novaeangliae]